MAGIIDFGFHEVELLKEQPLGRGSYGAVCKAKCDELLCAAKIVHPTLFMMDVASPKNIPLEKFHQECRLLCAVKHPNIVQYLGTYREPDTRHLVLLMELCNESLTDYLERNAHPLPYHVQVNLGHDIALALVYLHKNGLIHRDLSSNNVLLMKDLRAKITDFGMSRFMHRQLTPLSLCPGTQAYMPPESLNQNPHYSPKLDCFSFGVLAIQIITQKFPDPGERFESIPDSNSPTGFLLQPILEDSRRSTHISLIQTSHPFRPLILICLSYKEQQRPTAVEICRKMAEFKDTVAYTNSMVLPLLNSTHPCSKNKSIQTSNETEQIQQLKKQLEEAEIKQRNTEAQFCDAQATAKKKRDDEVKELKDKLQEMQKKLDYYQNSRSEQEATKNHKQVDVLSTKTPKQNSTLSLAWELIGVAPQEFYRGSAVVLGNSIYCHSSGKRVVFKFNPDCGTWSTLSPCQYSHFSLAIVDGKIVVIGGYDFTTTNQLFSYSVDRSWIKHYEPMLTARCNAVSVSTQQSLIVAGGDASGYNEYLDVVEVMDISSGKWKEVARLSCPHSNLSGAITSSGRLYLGGGVAVKGRNLTYSCSLSDLLSSQPRGGRFRALSFTQTSRAPIWHEMASPPVTQTTLVTLDDQLLAVGGQNAKHKAMANVYNYDEDTNTWKEISSLMVSRCRCITSVVEGKILCIGGQGENTIEIAPFL